MYQGQNNRLRVRGPRLDGGTLGSGRHSFFSPQITFFVFSRLVTFCKPPDCLASLIELLVIQIKHGDMQCLSAGPSI